MNESQENMNPTGSTQESFYKRNKNKLRLAAFMVSGAILLSHPQDVMTTKDEIKNNARIAYTVFPVTEGAAWLGAGLMLASAGKKIGNPLTVKSRLNDIKSELSDNALYRTGWSIGALGAVGTSATVSVGAVYSLPESTWPVAAAISAASIGFSTIPFRPNRIQDNGGKS